MLLSIVIPAYNEASNLQTILSELRSALLAGGWKGDYEIIVVDDHSSDSIFQDIQTRGESQVQCIRLSRRSGSHVAVRAGLSATKGDVALCLSADGQDDPQVLRQMLEKWETGKQIIWALRFRRNNEPLFLRLFSSAFYKVLKAVTKGESESMDLERADFYMLDRKVVDAINHCPERNTSLFGLIVWLGFRQDFVEYERRERRTGRSKWSFRSRYRLAKDWIIAFSGLPLKIMTLAGFILTLLGFAYALWVLINSILGDPIQGWTSLMITTLILGGIQLTMLGIIGEYLWRTLDESRLRPLFFIENVTSRIESISSKKGLGNDAVDPS